MLYGMAKCSEDCGRDAVVKGMCDMHYKRTWRHGDPSIVKVSAGTYRAGHPGYWLGKAGDPRHGNGAVGHRSAVGKRGSETNRWVGDAAGYAAVHGRLQRERGNARDYICADCGVPAHEWAFDETAGFSTDLNRYRPLCCSCHRRFDHASS